MKKEKWKYFYYKITLNFSTQAKLINSNSTLIKMRRKSLTMIAQSFLDNRKKL